MKPDLERAQRIGSHLILYKNSLAKRNIAVVDDAELRAILDQRSPDTLAAEQELVMALRFYTQEREQQIGCGEFRSCSSEEESLAARCFSLSTKIIFDRANVKGVACIKSEIAATIEQDISTDAIKWRAVHAEDEELLKRQAVLWSPNKPQESDTEEDAKSRKKFADGSLRWCKEHAEHRFRKYYGTRIEMAMCKMLVEHRNYWAQRPTEPYDNSALDHIFAFSLYGGNYGLGSLFGTWDRYLKERISNLFSPFGRCTEEESAVDNKDRRKRPIEWPHSHPNAREIMESHIRQFIREDIIADIPKWERHAQEIEDSKKRHQERRLERIQELRDEFISKIRSMFGAQVLEMISNEDINRYSFGIVDRRERKDDLWYSILQKYQFDGLTKSCVYFIRQGNAIKIGITDELDRRFAQIKTSAAAACKIENVVYTHHGRTLERKLHQSLARFNSHLEWFALPPIIEKMLFAAKSVKDIEDVLTRITGSAAKDLPNEMTDRHARL